MQTVASTLDAPSSAASPQSRRARLRAFSRLEWWPRSEEAAVPKWVHFLFWGALLLLDGLAVYSNLNAGPKHRMPQDQLVLRALLTNGLSGSIFYFNWMVLVPGTVGRGRLWPYLGGVLLLLAAYVPLRFGISGLIGGGAMEEAQTTQQKLMMIIPYTLLGLSTIFFSSGLRITGDYLSGLRNHRELERQQLLTELAMLKTQINPHFLFNTLNNIYSLTSRKSDKAPEAVLRLAEIMRYLLYESSTDTVPISRELAHLHSFLDLQRLRLPASAPEAIRFDVEGAGPDCAHPIAPLLLLPLVENAFKHGDLAARPVAVHISLHLAPDGLLRFSVLNHVAPADAERDLPRQPGGVGLVNLRRRLELLYPSRYALDVQTPPGQHIVTMVLLP
ncbi:sensor histidine kinase [Hymenobacter sp. J193]|uniref:sensor histidine kinase n=1 Tax=Hymenobacter sp. J193 TaxID=2898429 RepID=UPI0021518A25|nr:sensor histidine kinase [Hymenobacter sp. J193]MCR5887590.1 sensor histidine kinase [Hymenobacter sp. J193]